MYAKLFSRITESSLMEEKIEVRYVFMMLLAISDPKGFVIGTDVAIARRMNMATDQFRECLTALMAPDPDSNSMEHEGRRVLLSEQERGYFLVNYLTYRDQRDKEGRREYMKEYMREKRRKPGDVNSPELTCKLSELTSKPEKLTVNPRKPPLAQEEGEEQAEGEENPPLGSGAPSDWFFNQSAEAVLSPKPGGGLEKLAGFDAFWTAYPRKTAKEEARKSWIKKGCARIASEIIKAIRAQVGREEWVRDGGKYIPHPATWINSGRWSDEFKLAPVKQEDPDDGRAF